MFAPCNMGFYWKLRKRRYDQAEPRTYHQRWSLTLLWMLLWFNDPFAAAAVYTGWAKFFAALFIASASVFVALILLFWLCFLSDLRFMQHRWEEVSRGFCYWVPKARRKDVQVFAAPKIHNNLQSKCNSSLLSRKSGDRRWCFGSRTCKRKCCSSLCAENKG